MTDRFGEIADLCHRIYVFQAKLDWRFKSLPVICWEFGEIGEFLNARLMLEKVCFEARRGSCSEMVRMPDRSTVEMDVCGVTFRLSCPAIYQTADGQHRGVNELRYGKDIITNYPPNPGGCK